MSVQTRPPATVADGVVGASAPGWRAHRRTGRFLKRWLPPLVTLLIFLAGWYFVSYGLLSADRRFLLPPPHAVVDVAFLDPLNRSDILQALWLSSWVAALGLLISIVLGMALAIAMSQARWVERSLYPYAVILHCIPTLALVPVIGFWFDFGLTSRLVVTVLIALFPVISSTLFGLQSADRVGEHANRPGHSDRRRRRLGRAGGRWLAARLTPAGR